MIHAFQQLLGLMAIMLNVIPWAMLHMRSLQAYPKRHLQQGEDPQSHRIPTSAGLSRSLTWWTRRSNVFNGTPLIPLQPDVILTTDVSKAGWGGYIPDCSTQGLWTSSESELHINIHELKAIFLAPQVFEDKLSAKTVLCR